ncbi:G-type lectin S-receptor-like serine/threonine-protein kinase LECRK1 [Alnus glutinosa]|uniref:G-type lectin S-receptor-like serine/threonine-protein kinase LECRK1 n=1 Tax=Alnus glutinosa TaxID=3517 RepID=UPI002D79FBC6|nr:G-type lectin S-receptor-like serine/threonine-protein kinase LECRK1 [Alnus glutinosa]
MMPTLFFPLLLLSAIFAQQGQSLVKRGSFLTPTTNSSWPSPSGLYAFGFYKQGNGFAVGIFLAGHQQETVVVWTADRDKPPVPADFRLNFTSDGKLVLQSAQGAETRLASTFPEGAITSVSMLDTGNFVVLDSYNQTIWQSFENPTDTFLPTQNLSHGHSLYSSISDTNKSTGKFQVLMQEDGWLAMYPVGTQNTIEDGYWGEGIDGQKSDVVLQLENNGHLYLINGAGVIIRNMTDGYPTKDVLYRLTIDPDGILRLYSHDMNQTLKTIKWSVPKDDICKPRGLCGDNGYCVLNIDQVSCKCLPQFEPVNKDDRNSGCQRNSTMESCKSSKGNFTMEPALHTVWENRSYSVFNSPSQANCGEACSQDCDCEAALFKDGLCAKHMLPLRFVRKNQTDSTVALIKVGTSTPTTNTTLPKETKKKHRSDHILIISVSLLAFVLVVFAISGIAIYRYRVSSYKMANNRNIVLSEDFAPNSFTYAELEIVTDGFQEELGRGAFGIVYKGAILNGQKSINVAVKRLDRLALADREREFQTETKVIGRIHHKNLVRLLGYCHEGPNRLLVYEYMSNGSLADLLFTPIKPSWDERIEIACYIARGLIYLHEECEPQIIHCDIKPQNILMDENRIPKISDFGLAKLLMADQSKTFTDPRGTKGYVAPEWYRNLPVTVKVDVYSFGIVLLEIICCRKSVDLNLPEEEAILEQWAYQCFEAGELGKLVNDEEVDNTQLERMAKVGLWCIMNEPSRRPSMKKVLLMLEGTVDIPVLPSPTSSFLSAM